MYHHMLYAWEVSFDLVVDLFNDLVRFPQRPFSVHFDLQIQIHLAAKFARAEHIYTQHLLLHRYKVRYFLIVRFPAGGICHAVERVSEDLHRHL